MLWGVLVSALCLIVVLVFSCWLYFAIRKKHAHAKFLIEGLFIGLAISLSIVAKFVIFYILQDRHEFIDNVNTFIRALYAGIGGLTFEGLESFEGDTVSRWLQCFYFASSVYAGIMTLFIISAKANYEFYSVLSFISLSFGQIKRKNVHVITALTEETLYLARDIKSKDPKAVVVFASPTLEPFDKQNELCREVMARGFLYWSYSKNKNNPKSIAAVLHLKGQNNKHNFNLHFVVYAFDSHDHIPQEENNLDLVFDDIAVRTMRKDNLRVEYCLLTRREINFQAYGYHNREMMLEFAKNNFDSPYYSKCKADVLENVKNEKMYNTENLTEDNVLQTVSCDTNFVKYFLTASGKAQKSWKTLEKAIKEDYAQAVVVNIWCEAFAIGRQTIDAMFQTNIETDVSKPQQTFAHYLAQNDDGIRIWTIGFASTGQSLTNELFVQSTGVNEHGETRDFMADVFDLDANSLGGIFRASRQNNFYLYDDTTSQNAEWTALLNAFDKWCESTSECFDSPEVLSDCRKYLQDTAFPLYFRNSVAKKTNLDVEMPMPIFRFHPVSCNEFAFFDSIDNHLGAECKSRKYNVAVNKVLSKMNFLQGDGTQQDISSLEKVKSILQHAITSTMPAYPQIVVISTGDDFRNIRLANTLVQDIANEHTESSEKYFAKQYIIVNVWDKHNNPLIVSGNGIWNSEHDVLIADDYVVLVVGNNDKIYTYDSIVGCVEEENYNWAYDGMDAFLNEKQEKEKKSKKNVSNNFVAMVEEKTISEIAPRALKVPSSVVGMEADAVVEILKTLQLAFDNIESKNSKYSDEDLLKVLQQMKEKNPSLQYAKLDIWKRESTKSAILFAPVHRQTYLELCKKYKREDGSLDLIKVYSQLSILEHCRWVRMHQINGWIYNQQKNEIARQHNCIKPFKQLADYVILYDTLNAMWAITQLDKDIRQ